MKIIFLIIFISFSAGLNAEENKYNIKDIPSSLLKDADAVVRNNTISFEIIDEGKAVERNILAVTIFNENGRHYGEITEFYGEFKSIDDFEGKIYDEKGEEIRELDGSNIKDYGAFQNFPSDARIRAAELYHNKYPYTIEFITEISYDGYIDWPTWRSRNSRDAVEFTRIEVITPENYKLRYWCNIDSVKPEILNGSRTFVWEASNLEALPEEPMGYYEDAGIIVRIAPADFEIGGFKGNMETWENFGSWMYNLYKEKNVLPPEAQKEISKLISPSDNTEAKVKKIYKYVQSRTNYVSIQLGIGGWEPLDAEYVHQRGYGDCKALSNYTVALLKEAGITAYPVLVSTKDNSKFVHEFPSHQFNHVIVCVPLVKDTVWLECTSQILLPGNITEDNENRKGLMLTPEGGVVVNTPVSNAETNLQVKNIKIELGTGTAEGTGLIQLFGNQQVTARSVCKNHTPQEQEKWIIHSFDAPDVKLKNFSFTLSDEEQKASLDFNFVLPRFSTVSGKRLFFSPNLMEKYTNVPKDVEKRFSPIKFIYPYYDIDSVYFEIPKGYKAEGLPGNVDINSSFGEFSSKAVLDGDSGILYVRSLKINEYEIPADSYPEYKQFFSAVVKADRAQIVLVKK